LYETYIDKKYTLLKKDGSLVPVTSDEPIKSINKNSTLFKISKKYNLNEYKEKNKNYDSQYLYDDIVSEYTIVNEEGKEFYKTTSYIGTENEFIYFKDLEKNDIYLDQNGIEIVKIKDSQGKIVNNSIKLNYKTDIIPIEEYDKMSYSDPKKDQYKSDYEKIAYKPVSKLVNISNGKVNEKKFNSIGENNYPTGFFELNKIIDNYNIIVSDVDKPKYKYIINEKYETVFDPLNYGFEITSDTINLNRYIEVTDLKSKIMYVYDIKSKKIVLDKTVYRFIEYNREYIKASTGIDPNEYTKTVQEVFDLEFNKIDIPIDSKLVIKSFKNNQNIILETNYDTKPKKTYLYSLPSKKLIFETQNEEDSVEALTDNYYVTKIQSNYNIINKDGSILIKDLKALPTVIDVEAGYNYRKENYSKVKYFTVKSDNIINVFDTTGKLIYENYNFDQYIFDTNYVLTKKDKELISECRLITITGDYDCLKQK
jgi:hypothetical protein